MGVSEQGIPLKDSNEDTNELDLNRTRWGEDVSIWPIDITKLSLDEQEKSKLIEDSNRSYSNRRQTLVVDGLSDQEKRKLLAQIDGQPLAEPTEDREALEALSPELTKKAQELLSEMTKALPNPERQRLKPSDNPLEGISFGESISTYLAFNKRLGLRRFCELVDRELKEIQSTIVDRRRQRMTRTRMERIMACTVTPTTEEFDAITKTIESHYHKNKD